MRAQEPPARGGAAAPHPPPLLRLLIGGDHSISSISLRAEGCETPAASAFGILGSLLATPRTFPASSRVRARLHLRPLLLAPPQQSGGPGSLESQVSSGGAREAGVATPGSRGTISAPEAQRSPHPSRQDASYLVPREERVFVQDGPAGLGGRRHCGALHAALPESEQPLRLLRGSGRLLSLHELSRGGGR